MSEQSDQLEATFVSLVEQSWQRYNEDLENKYMDDLLVGAVVTSMVDAGYSLIDLNSDGVNHYLRFEHLPSSERLIFELKNLSEDLVTAKTLGRWGRAVIGYGTSVANPTSIMNAVKSEFKSGFLDAREPGVITFDADMTAGYIYAQVPLLLSLDQYFGDNFSVDYNLLQKHLGATIHSLKKYLKGRIG